MTSRIQVWTAACRPKTLIASLSPASLALALALSDGHFSPLCFLLTLMTGLLIQIGTNLTNDYCDFIKGADTEERKGFLRVTQAGLVTPSSMKQAILAVFFLAMLTGSYLAFVGGVGIALLLALYILLSVLYTAGPFPLAYLGLGECLVLILYGPIACLIAYYLQTQTLSYMPLLLGLCPGAFSTAIICLNNLRDIDEDQKAGKNTLIVRFGRRFGKIEYASMMLLPFCLLIPLSLSHPFALFALFAFPQALFLILSVKSNENPYELNSLFARTGKLFGLFTFLLFIGLLL